MPRPNIVLITTDQHNAEIIGCAGNALVRTPHLDRLAATGVVFDQAYTPHPVCTPARTSIFTGQTADHHGVPYNINLREDHPDPPDLTGLAADATAFPSILAGNGYHTALFGKLHAKQAGEANFGLQTMRLAEGKGQFVEYGSGPDDYRQYLRDKGWSDSAWRTWEHADYAERGWITSPLPEEDYIDTWTATEAVRFIEQVDAPFFAWVSFSGPHTPWDPPEPYASMYDPAEIPFPARREGELEEKHPQWADDLARTIPAVPPRSQDPERHGGIERAYSRFPDAQLREMLAAYYGQITLIDHQIGRVLDALQERGLRENTLILFASDHGDHLGNNWALFKYGVQYDSLARIPFIINWPGHTDAGLRRSELVSLIDIASTFLEAAGLAPVDPVDGQSLLPLCREGEVPWRDQLVWPCHPACIVSADWKYMLWPDGFEELYDRRTDPHELRNLASTDRHAALCADFRKELAHDGR